LVSIGEYELEVMKSVYAAGGSVDVAEPDLDVSDAIQGVLNDALGKLEEAEYIDRVDGRFYLSDLAEEYLSVLGLI
jgi:hypothetical protein